MNKAEQLREDLTKGKAFSDFSADIMSGLDESDHDLVGQPKVWYPQDERRGKMARFYFSRGNQRNGFVEVRKDGTAKLDMRWGEPKVEKILRELGFEIVR